MHAFSATTPERRRLDAAAFAFVMATGIVSIAAALRGLSPLSDALFAVACVSWIALAAALVGRALHELTHPRPRSFALVAATAVIATRLSMLGLPTGALAVGALAAASWLGLFARRPWREPSDGTWFLLVVGTESLAVLAAVLAPHWNAALLDAALGWWVLGLCLYLPVLGAIGAELRRRTRFGPDLWITMGALAISTLAGAELLLAARRLDALEPLWGLFRIASFTTWALATAWIVPLVAAELRYRSTWRDQSGRWSFVFPLGMYAVASHTLAHAVGLGPLATVGRIFTVVALVAWAATVLVLAAAGLAARRTATRENGAPTLPGPSA